MKSEIKYIGFYNIPNAIYKRNCTLSAINKMDYISDVINRTGRNIKIISPSWYVDDSPRYNSKEEVIIDENKKLLLVPSFFTSNRLTMKLKYYFSSIWLFFYLLKHVEKDEEIIAYHSLALMKPLFFAKKAKGFKIIYEVEEVYTDIIPTTKKKKKQEIKFISLADKYIFPTELLNKKINSTCKPYIVSHGSYKIEDKKNSIFTDDKTHIVYAGTFDPAKGGAITAINVAQYLNNNYHIHIIGFGTEEQKKEINYLIEKISKKTHCLITYNGLLKGDEYIKFLQSCDIGLSTQNPEGEYNDTSFPSKVLSYLCNGLRVVTIRIKVLETSAVNKMLFYYDTNHPKEIAEVIKKIDKSKEYNSKIIIEELDRSFEESISYLIDFKVGGGKID